MREKENEREMERERETGMGVERLLYTMTQLNKYRRSLSVEATAVTSQPATTNFKEHSTAPKLTSEENNRFEQFSFIENGETGNTDIWSR